MEVQTRPVVDLIPDPNNARKHDQKNLDAIKGSLAKFGQQKPIVIDKNNIVLAGNGTLASAKALGWKDIQVVVSTLEGFNASAYALADNRSSELAEWDTDVLSDTLKALHAAEFDIGEIGFEDDFLKVEPMVGNTDPDEVPENVETRCKPGDLWILGNHRLLCGDSTNVQHVERLMGGEKADMVFTDPPFPNNSKIFHEMIENIDQAFNSAFIGCDGTQAWFWDNCSEPPFGKMINARHVWHKTNGWQAGHWEAINIFANSDTRKECLVFSVPNVGVDGEIGTRKSQGNHPTPKPIKLVIDVIKHEKGGDKILDLFLGSGSTLIACEKTNRKCYGMEIDPHYCDVIIERWEKFTGKKATQEASNG